MSATVDIEDLVISYGKDPATQVRAVDHLTVSAHGGQVLGILGGNGAGKTSTMRALAGLLPATSGRLVVAGYDMSLAAGAEAAREVLGYCPDTGGLMRQATVREHLGVALGLRGQLDRWPAALDLVEQFGLTGVLDRETLGFSHGMSRRLSVLLAALTAEKVLILDEPFDGVDPTGVNATAQVIDAATTAGLTVIVSTHLLDLLTEVSDRIVVMVRGKLVDDQPAAVFEGKDGRTRYADLLADHAR